jgi:hypothetical protein
MFSSWSVYFLKLLPLRVPCGRSDAGPNAQQAFRHLLTRVAATVDQNVYCLSHLLRATDQADACALSNR